MCDRRQQLACFDSLDLSLRAFLKKSGEQLSFTEVEDKVLSFLENYYFNKNKNGQTSSKADKSFSLNGAGNSNSALKDSKTIATEEVSQASTFGTSFNLSISGKEGENE